MRLGKLVLITIAGGALACSTALAKPGTLVGSGEDSGTPNAFAKATANHPRTLLVRIKAKPGQRVEVIWDTNCSRHAKGKVRDGQYTIGGKKLRKLKKGFKRPDECLVNVIAAYEDASLDGKIKIEIFAR
jgi:hypothetical protein